MWVFVPFPHFIFFLNPAVDKSQIIKLFILLPTLKTALFKEINLKAAKSADMVLSVEKASGHGCFSQIGYRYMNHCSIFPLLSLTLSFVVLWAYSQSRFTQRGCSVNLGSSLHTLYAERRVLWLLRALLILWSLLLLVQQLLGPSPLPCEAPGSPELEQPQHEANGLAWAPQQCQGKIPAQVIASLVCPSHCTVTLYPGTDVFVFH